MMVALADQFSVWSPSSCVPDVLERVFAPACLLNTWQYARKNIVLDEKASPTNPGPVDENITPHTKFFQECLDNPAVSKVTVKKNGQGGFTQGCLNKIVKVVATDPVNFLYVIDSLQEIKRIVKTRLNPMLLSCEASRQTITEDEDNETQTLTMYLRDMTGYYSGGGSIGAAANKAVSLAIIDEADKIPRVTKGHTHIVQEVDTRFKTVTDFKRVVLSVPNEEQDITTVEYKKGTQHKYYVPCPHCAHYQEMIPENVIFAHCKDASGAYDNERVKREAYYKCDRAGSAACPDGKIYDHHKRAMSIAGEWRQTNPNPEPGHISMESSDLFSLFPGASIGLIAIDIISTQKNPSEKKGIWANRFGREWKTSRAEITTDQIRALIGDYERGTVPADCGRVIYFPIASDVQGDAKKWVRAAINRKEEIFVVDYGASLSFDDLNLIADTPITLPDGTSIISPEGIIDEGYKTKLVRSFVVRTHHRFFPAKGRGGVQNRGSLVAESATGHDGDEFNVYHFNDDAFKVDLYLDRIRDFPKIRAGTSQVPRIWLPRDVDAEFVAELCGEHQVPVVTPFNFTKYVWEKKSTNDYGDALKLILVLWFIAKSDVLAAIVEEEKRAAQLVGAAA